jgi:CubicO group peptidase (beta-lactamase class C family)
VRHLDAEIRAEIERWKVPGLGYAVSLKGDVALQGGAGVRGIDCDETVDEHTIFAIGSVTKSMTAAAVAMLVDDGTLSWSDRVVDRLPEFRLYDPYATPELTIRDLLTHRSGLARGDLMWYKSGYDSAEVLQRVRHLPPSWSLRSAFGYQNIMYLAAGELIEKLTGTPWERFVKERIFDPLGMNESRVDAAELDVRGNVASPHAEIDDSVTLIRHHAFMNSRPAGSVYSSPYDMLKWLRFQLGDGTYEGRRILSSSSMRETHTPQTVIARIAPWTYLFSEATSLSYGMGWFLWNYRGRTIVSHGGNIDGMAALACVVPEEQLAFVALSNLDGSLLPNALLHRILDETFGKTSHDWLNEFYSVEQTLKAQLRYAERERSNTQLTGTKPSLPISAYAGAYEDAFYGRASIAQADGDLKIECIGFRGTLQHRHLDTFTFVPDDPILSKYKPLVLFTLDEFAEITHMTLSVLGAPQMRFERKPHPPAAIELTREDLPRYEGCFVSPQLPVSVRVEILDGALKANVPGDLAGQPDVPSIVAALQPLGEGRFALASSRTTAAFQFNGETPARLRIEAPHTMPLEFIKASETPTAGIP